MTSAVIQDPIPCRLEGSRMHQRLIINANAKEKKKHTDHDYAMKDKVLKFDEGVEHNKHIGPFPIILVHTVL